MTAALVFIVCMSGDPQNCRRERVRAFGGCQVVQALLAEYFGDHPDWRLVETPRCKI